MTVYIVGESLECEEANIRVFSTKEKAKEFIINSYEKFINHPKNIELAKNWSPLDEVKHHFEYVHGIEDFMYVDERVLDDNSEIIWNY